MEFAGGQPPVLWKIRVYKEMYFFLRNPQSFVLLCSCLNAALSAVGQSGTKWFGPLKKWFKDDYRTIFSLISFVFIRVETHLMFAYYPGNDLNEQVHLLWYVNTSPIVYVDWLAVYRARGMVCGDTHFLQTRNLYSRNHQSNQFDLLCWGTLGHYGFICLQRVEGKWGKKSYLRIWYNIAAFMDSSISLVRLCVCYEVHKFTVFAQMALPPFRWEVPGGLWVGIFNQHRRTPLRPRIWHRRPSFCLQWLMEFGKFQ